MFIKEGRTEDRRVVFSFLSGTLGVNHHLGAPALPTKEGRMDWSDDGFNCSVFSWLPCETDSELKVTCHEAQLAVAK